MLGHNLWVVACAIWLHVVRIHLRRVLLMLLLVLMLLVLLVVIMRPPPAHIRWHALPCRQMTAVHHAGLGGRCFSQLDRVEVELELRVARVEPCWELVVGCVRD